jgi:hypothetical protein
MHTCITVLCLLLSTESEAPTDKNANVDGDDQCVLRSEQAGSLREDKQFKLDLKG